MSLKRWAASSFVTVILGAVVSVWAQTSSAIVGTVKDSSGGVMAGVTVTVVHEATQDKYQAVTNEAGDYRINLRQVGRFKVRAEMQGFKTTVFSNILIEVGRTARVDASLEVGELSETLVVEAANPLVRSETSAIGEIIDNQKILELPLKGREYIQLATLMPGVASRNKRSAGHAVTQGFAIQGNGQRTAANNYRLNGVNNMGANMNQQTAAPPLDAVQEFQVVRNLYPVEYGRGSGVVVDVRGKSGGNELHGSLYEFNRNATMNARQYFARSKPGFTFNQYGGSVGGPVWLPKLYDGRNKTFFFFAYEALKDRRATVSKIGVPTPAERNGDFSQSPYNKGVTLNWVTGQPYPGGIIPQSDWSPLGRRIMNMMPLPNNPESPLNYIGIQGEPRDAFRKIYRFDQKIGLHSAFAALNFLPSAKVIKHYLVSPLSDGRQGNTYRQLGFGYTHVITPQILSETRAGYLDSKITNGPNGDFTNYPKLWGYAWVPPDGPLSGPPRHLIDLGFGAVQLMGQFGQEDYGDNAYNLVQTFSANHGKHYLKAGVDLIHERYHILTAPFSRGVYAQNGNYTGNPWADLLLGVDQRSIFSLGAANIPIRRTQQAYFFQDDWKIHPNLTLNLGVRYDLIPGWASKFITSFDFKTGQVIYAAGAVSDVEKARFRFPVRFDGPETAYNAQGDWAPRFGLAWRPFGDNKTVVRSGFGMFFVSPSQLETGRNSYMPPWLAQGTYFGSPSSPLFIDKLPAGVISQVYENPAIQPSDVNFQDAYTEHWNLAVQREVAPNLALELAYVGNRSAHLTVTRQGHVFAAQYIGSPTYPGIGTAFDYRSNGFDGQYHSFQLQATQRRTHGLAYQASYTWGKALTNARDSGVDRSFSDADGRNEWGRSDSDARHIFAVAGIYELPVGKGYRYLSNMPRVLNAILGGWKLNFIAEANTGYPFELATGALGTFAGTTGVIRPDIVPGRKANLPPSERTRDRWFDPTAFTNARTNCPLRIGEGGFTTQCFGTLGRNVMDGPGYLNMDLGISKLFNIREGHRFEVRGEFFNAFNHANFYFPQTSIIFSTPGANKPTGAFDMRSIQVGARYSF